MARMFDTLSLWARKTTAFAEFLVSGLETDTPPEPHAGPVYRLRHWPGLPGPLRTAAVYRTLSVMSQRPVNRHWMLRSSQLKPQQVDALLALLESDGAVEVIDTSAYPSAQR